MVLFHNCVRQSRSPTKMAATVQLASCVVIESSYDPGVRLQAPESLWFLVIGQVVTYEL
jgi:hypothetical protein